MAASNSYALRPSEHEETALLSKDEKTFSVEMPPSPTSASLARRCTRTTLRAWRISPTHIEVAELLVSELVTNAIAATAPDRQDVQNPATQYAILLRLEHQVSILLIEVSDPSPHQPTKSTGNADAESGRGLMIVQALSEEWGYLDLPSGGKTVFSLLKIDEPSTGEPAPSQIVSGLSETDDGHTNINA